MKLTADEREVISCMYFRADMPLREVAEETGLREHVVRRSLENLTSRGVIKLSPLVNPFALGLSEYLSLLKIAPGSLHQQERMVEELARLQDTTFVGTVGGEWQVSLMFATRGVREVPAFFARLNARIPGGMYEASTAACVSVSLFAPKHLGARQYSVSQQTYAAGGAVHDVDELDAKILRAFLTMTSTSLAALARGLGIPVSTLTYRLDSMRRRGILVGINYALPPFHDGLFPCAFLVSASAMPAEMRTSFFDYCARHQAYTYLIELVGPWSFDLGVRLSDPRQVNTLIADIQQRFAPYVSAVTYVPVHEHINVGAWRVGCLS